MTETDDDMTIEDAVTEIDILRYRHGTLGACKVYLQRHTDRWSWIRFGLFVVAIYALYTGLRTVPLYGPYGLTVETLTPVESAVWTVLVVGAMWATYRGIEHVLE